MVAHRLSLPALRTMAVALLVPILCALAPARVPADEPPPGARLKRWIAEESMAGNWFGARDVLRGWGINPTIFYATDLQASVAGGLRRGEAYAGQLTVEIDANMEKLVGLTGSGSMCRAPGPREPISPSISGTRSSSPSTSKATRAPRQHVLRAIAVGRPARPQGWPLLDWL